VRQVLTGGGVQLEDHRPLVDRVDVVGVGEAMFVAADVMPGGVMGAGPVPVAGGQLDHDSVEHVLLGNRQHVGHGSDLPAVRAVDRGSGR
jgi:hypothetical protein